MLSNLRLEVIVRFVDIGGFAYRYCLNFLFIIIDLVDNGLHRYYIFVDNHHVRTKTVPPLIVYVLYTEFVNENWC